MARKPRFTIPGVPQHVIQRGHNREPCFYSKENYISKYPQSLKYRQSLPRVALWVFRYDFSPFSGTNEPESTICKLLDSR